MSVPVGAIVSISTKITEYFGFIEGVDTKVTKLLHQSFNSAKMNLEYARSEGENKVEYLKQAKARFIDAVAVEENENKILALTGLIMCQVLLNEKENASRSMDCIDDVQLTNFENLKCYFSSDRKEKFEKSKQKAFEICRSLGVVHTLEYCLNRLKHWKWNNLK